MDNMDTPQAKLLFIASDLYKKQQITQLERSQLKDMITGEYKPLYELLDLYPNNQILINEIILLLRKPDQTEHFEMDPNSLIDPNSPMDSKIMKKKRQRNEIKDVKGYLTLNQ